MSYLKNNYHWLLFIIVIFGSIGAVVFTQQRADTGPNVVFEPPSPEVLQRIKDSVAARNAQDTVKPPPPGETEESGYWHGDHWHRTAPVETSVDTQPNDSAYGVTRQGTRYLKNPAWADRPEAHAIPTGPPLNIDWSDLPTILSRADWYDPRTWESYRNFWGFDRPHVRENGTVPWRVVIDNHGTPLQWHENIALVTFYTKRKGFCPTPEQLAQYESLQAEYEDARLLGLSETTTRLQQQINTLVASAQGELPNPYSYEIDFYGDPYKPGERTPPEVSKERMKTAIRNLYKRLGIEHLYDLYEHH